MKARRVRLLSVLAALSFAALAARADTLVLTDCALIDGTGASRVANAVVVVKDGKILEAGPAAKVSVPPDARILKLEGATAMPGIINAHVHRSFSEERLRTWAAAGVTSVRDMASFGESIEEVMKWRSESRERPELARLFAVGPMITVPDGYGRMFVTSAADARSKVAQLAAAGVDAIKASLESGYAGRTGLPVLTDEELAAIVEAAHAAGKRATVHITMGRYFERAVKAGVDEIAHIPYTEVPEEELIDAARRGITITPTFTVFRNFGAPTWTCQENLRVFAAAGGRVALGNDYAGGPGEFEPGVPLYEMSMMREAGMSPMQVIVASTKNAARSCGAESYLGTIEKGKLADILVVRGDPLEDLGVLGEPLLVMKAGTIIADGRGRK
jgi:imidazolonepropionase-like amidohydrolase